MNNTNNGYVQVFFARKEGKIGSRGHEQRMHANEYPLSRRYSNRLLTWKKGLELIA
jgi:hypothetical protein